MPIYSTNDFYEMKTLIAVVLIEVMLVGTNIHIGCSGMPIELEEEGKIYGKSIWLQTPYNLYFVSTINSNGILEFNKCYKGCYFINLFFNFTFNF